MAMQKKGKGGGEAEENVFWVTMSDLLLGLAVVFMTLFILAITGFNQEKVEQKKQQSEVAAKINEQLQAEKIDKLLTSADIDKEFVLEKIKELSKEDLNNVLAAAGAIPSKAEVEKVVKKEGVLPPNQIKEIYANLSPEVKRAMGKDLNDKESKSMGELEKMSDKEIKELLKSIEKGQNLSKVDAKTKESVIDAVSEKDSMTGLSEKAKQEIIDAVSQGELAGLSPEEKQMMINKMGKEDKQSMENLNKLNPAEKQAVLEAIGKGNQKDLSPIANLTPAEKKALKDELGKNASQQDLNPAEMQALIDALGKGDLESVKVLAGMSDAQKQALIDAVGKSKALSNISDAQKKSLKEAIAKGNPKDVKALQNITEGDKKSMMDAMGEGKPFTELSDAEKEAMVKELLKKEALAGMSEADKKALQDKMAKEKGMNALKPSEQQKLTQALKSGGKAASKAVEQLSPEELNALLDALSKSKALAKLSAADKKAMVEAAAVANEKKMRNLTASQKEELLKAMGKDKALAGLTPEEKQALLNMMQKEKGAPQDLSGLSEAEKQALLKAISKGELKDLAYLAGLSDELKKALEEAIGKDALKFAKKMDGLSKELTENLVESMGKDKNFGNLSAKKIKEIIDKTGKDKYEQLLAELPDSAKAQIVKEMAKSDPGIKAKLEEIEANDGINVDGFNGEVKISDVDLFELGSATLSEKGKRSLDKFIPIYVDTIFSNPDLVSKMDGIVIQGHTDSQMYRGISSKEGQFVKNMDLSLRRAQAVADYMFRTSYNKKYTGGLIKSVKVEGKSFTEPILTNGMEDYAKSRRVVIKVVSKSSDLDLFLMGTNQ